MSPQVVPLDNLEPCSVIVKDAKTIEILNDILRDYDEGLKAFRKIAFSSDVQAPYFPRKCGCFP